MTAYQLQYAAAWIVLVIGLVAQAILLVADPADLGLTPIAYRWISVMNAVIIGLGAVLPSVRRTPTSYDNPGPAHDPDPMPRDR
jgi:hypothetical protein